MDRGSILSGGAFRAAVYATMIFLRASLAVAFAGYRFIQVSKLAALRGEADVIATMLARLFEDKGREAFETQAERISWHPDLGARFVGVFDGGWTESPAMIDAASLPPESWTVVSLRDDAGAAGNYYVWRTRVGAFPVVLGVDLSAVAHTESVFMRALLGTGIVMTIGFMVLGRVASRAV